MKSKERFPNFKEKQDYIKWLYDSCLTSIFLKRVMYVYGAKSIREALSLVWSNDLVETINYMADYYYNKRKQDKERKQELKRMGRERGLSVEEKREKQKLEVREWKQKIKKEDPIKWQNRLIQENEHNKKIFYSKKELDEEVEKLKKKLSYMDCDTLIVNPTKVIKEQIKNKKTERILVIQKNL